MSRFISKQYAKRQAGATTLLISVVILFLATVIIIAVSRTTVMEQRMSANEVRARQAFEAAQAGLDHAFNYLTSDLKGIDRDGVGGNGNRIADTDTQAGAPLTIVAPATYRFAYCDPTDDKVAVNCPDDPVNSPNCDFLNDQAKNDGTLPAHDSEISEATLLKAPLIVSCGWSDDRIGRQLIRQNAGTVPALGGSPTAPLISKGAVNVTGSATITNYYNNLTIWSGDSLSNIGNSGKTYVRNPNIQPPLDADPPPAPPPANTNCSGQDCYVKVTDKNTTGPDIIMDDPTLKNLTDELMFKNYLGAENLNDYKANVATRVISNSSTDVGSLSGVKAQAIVIEGDTGLCNCTIGTRDQPVTLVINGNLTGGGNVTVHGVVYVIGNTNVAGNKTIYGSMIVQGQVAGTGSLDVVYDPYAVKNARDYSGRPALISGSWRDW